MLRNATLPPGWRIEAHEALDSTNAELRRLVEAGGALVEEGLVVAAEQQLAGRGRRGRAWESPRGNFSASVLVRVGGPHGEAGQLAFVAGVALHEALCHLAPGLALALKWPNDLLLEGRKLSGMLLETVFPPGAPAGQGMVIVGTGANLAERPGADPLYPTACLREAGVHVSPASLLSVYTETLAAWLARWRRDGFAPVRAAWLAAVHGLGGPVTARLADGTEHRGVFEALDADGALVLSRADGGRERILAGDVFFGVGAGDCDGGGA